MLRPRWTSVELFLPRSKNWATRLFCQDKQQTTSHANILNSEKMAYDSIIQLSQINMRITKGYKRSFPKWFSFWSVFLLILFQGTTKQDSNSEICQEALFCWFRHCHPQIKWCLSGMHVHKFLPINCTANHQKLLLKYQISRTIRSTRPISHWKICKNFFHPISGISRNFIPVWSQSQWFTHA